MKNITVSLAEQTAAWARVYAAQRGKSVSRLLGEMLQERMREVRDYNDAMRRFLAGKPFRFECSLSNGSSDSGVSSSAAPAYKC